MSDANLTQPFNITHFYHANKAKLPTGETVHRKEKLFVPEKGYEIPCVPYDDHFIYHTVQLGPAYRCTCGAAAVVAIAAGARQFVCYFHASLGYHATGGSQWV